MTASIKLLQRFQAVNGLSHFNAGVHLLALLLSSPAPTSHGGIRTSRYEVGRPAFLLVVTWGRYADAERCLRLLCACSAGPGELRRRLLGFPSLQVTMGFGLGMELAILPIYVSFLVLQDYHPQQPYRIRPPTSLRLSPLPFEMGAISNSVQFIETLPPTVRSEFSEGYSAQLRAVLYISAVALISMTLAWDINLKRARDMAGY
ncbi:Major facilitator superfamily transporter [Colletotrichum higginsianum IMI 349063]|uniref:Major facilitator superfamily transporter n=1 Tax=Colletotrichum higginsianum (strain IMI 349063) TaxID=759273 RepID=A0A1B7XRA5_COLHI|nr:Major facilitator superfamily transporter [Colletotrichum higginsianum IMI 349063]OBR02295.1 Major facilitator superfamily transporter [Colletotrichum higginsianum IMI 349063]